MFSGARRVLAHIPKSDGQMMLMCRRSISVLPAAKAS
jgi:hypothetical protein